jgi:hypothetical protein
MFLLLSKKSRNIFKKKKKISTLMDNNRYVFCKNKMLNDFRVSEKKPYVVLIVA